MRNTVLILLTSALQVFATGSYAQTKTISLAMNDATIREVLYAIQNQSEFYFLYNSELIDVARKVDITIEEEKVDAILTRLFNKNEVDFLIKDRYIVLTPVGGNAELFAEQQQPGVTGNVTDEQGLPLPGVTVLIKGTTQGAVTNVDGNYTIANLPEGATLQFSFVGMLSQEIIVGSQTEINVTLAVDAIGIEEVVAIGYGKMKKSDLTGAVISVDVQKLQVLPNVSVAQALQGTVAGLNVGAVDLTGQDPEISIRGNNTLSKSAGGESPLIVLDGSIYRGRLIEINPNDIASVDILKDASSAAIYGSQASNGVMVITTKQGTGTGDKPIVSYSGSYTFNTPSNERVPMAREEYLNKYKDANWRESRQGPDYLTPVPGWDMFSAGGINWAAGVKGYNEGLDYDWWGNFTGNGHLMEQNASVRGGGKTYSYFMSGGLSDNKGFIKNDEYKRYSYRVNIDANITDWLKIGMNSFLSSNDYSGTSPDIKQLSHNLTPISSPVDDNGEYYPVAGANYDINPYLMMEMQDEETQLNIFANIYAEIDLPFVKGLKYKIAYSQSYRNLIHNHFNRFDYNLIGQGYKNSDYFYDNSLDNILSYENTFNDVHNVGATLVYGVEKRVVTATDAIARGFSNPTLGYNRLQAGNPGLNSINTNREEETSLYSMGRLVYKYNNRYILTGTIRRDGFSGFGKNEKVGYFPSVALGWVTSEEDFFNIDWFNYLKLRGSYGLTGRRAGGRYETLARVSSGSVYGLGSETLTSQWISSLANNELGWEKTTGVNIGLDFGFLNSRIHGNIEYYNNNTRDILYPIKLPTMSGFNSINTNIGKVHNHGIEFAINTSIIKKRDLSWSASVNFSRNRNEIVSILGNDDDGDGVEDDLVEDRLFIGKPQSVIYDYTILGLWQLADEQNGTIDPGFSAGTYKIADLSGDNDYSPADMSILGYQDPSYRMGIANTFSYKHFELYMFINTIQGGKDYYYGNDDPNSSLEWQGGEQHLQNNNMPAGSWDYWMPENPDAKYRTLAVGAAKVAAPLHYTQRNFIRLQDLSVSYNIGNDMIKSIGFRNIKVYASAKNLFTITKWQGMDPEIGKPFDVRNMIPLMRSYTIGLNFEL